MSDILTVGSLVTPSSITFFDHRGEVGRLTFDNGIVSFAGNAEEAAKVFINEVISKNNLEIARLRAQVETLTVKLDDARHQIAAGDRLREAVDDVPDDVLDWGGYAGEYMKNKHGLSDDVSRYKKALADYDIATKGE